MYSFIVLPALALYLYIAYRAAGAAFRSTPHRTLRIVYPMLILLGLALLPFVDIFYPRWKLHELCATEAKTEILATTTLPAEYFNADGMIAHQAGNRHSVDWKRLSPVLRLQNVGSKSDSDRLQRVSYIVEDVRTGKKLLQQTSFFYRGGWMGFTNQGFGAANCFPGTNLEELLPRVVFKAAG